MGMSDDFLNFKFGDQKGIPNVSKSVVYKDKYDLPNGTERHFLLEIDRKKVATELACSEEEAQNAVDAVVKAMWRIKTWNL